MATDIMDLLEGMSLHDWEKIQSKCSILIQQYNADWTLKQTEKDFESKGVFISPDGRSEIEVIYTPKEANGYWELTISTPNSPADKYRYYKKYIPNSLVGSKRKV